MKKKRYEFAKKISVSLPEILLDDGFERMRNLGLTQFSHYIQQLMRADVKKLHHNERT